MSKDRVEEALEEFVAWLDDSLNGVRGEVDELCLGADRQEVVEQLEWKTENMLEEAEDVAQELAEEFRSKPGEVADE